MFTFEQKRRLRAVVHSPVTHLALLCAAVALAWIVYYRYEMAAEMEERRAAAEAEVAALEARKSALEERVIYLKSERGIETEMRRRFDVAREGEQVVVILEE
jgi:cell division protein FtsB